MNLNIFIAKIIGTKSDSTGKLSIFGSVISVVSVALSVAVIVISVAVAGGFRKEVRNKARAFSADMVMVAPGCDITSSNSPVRSNISYLNKLKQQPYIQSIYPVSYKRGVIKTTEEVNGVLFKGVDSTYNLDFFKANMVEGSLPSFAGGKMSNDIIISKRLADMLNLKVGDKVLTYFIDDDVKLRNFNLSGIFDARLEQLDKLLAIADIRQINRLNNWKNSVSGFEIFFKDGKLENDLSGEKTEKLKDEVSEIIYNYSKEEDDSVILSSLQDRFYILFDWLHLLDLNVLIILALMMAVAGFNMVSGLLIMLFERISQIGLFKALGMTNAAISKIFLVKSAIIVAKGMIYGNILAGALCFIEQKYHFITLNPDNYFVSSMPISYNIVNILAINAISFVVIMLIMLIPCRFIVGINPAQTMRMK